MSKCIRCGTDSPGSGFSAAKATGATLAHYDCDSANRDEIHELREQNAKLRRELEEANAEIGDLEDCRESLRKLGQYCGCDHVECADERQMQVQHIHEAFDAKEQQNAKLRRELSQLAEIGIENLERIDAGEDPHAAAAAVIPKVNPDQSGPRFKCFKCQDSGLVSVWHTISIKAVLEGRISEPPMRRTMSVACGCCAADAICLPDERTAPKGWHGWRQSSRYAPDRYCRCAYADVHNQERIAELVEWVQDYMKNRGQAPPDKRESVFDNWNQEASQTEKGLSMEAAS